jgi:hypothetical protein
LLEEDLDDKNSCSLLAKAKLNRGMDEDDAFT